MKARDYIPALRFGAKIYPEDFASPLTFADYWYVDGQNGSDADGNGKSVDKPYLTIQAAIDAATQEDVIFVRALDWGAGETDPDSYAENLNLPLALSGLQIVGVGTGRVQGGLPQIKKAGSTALITINAPGCSIRNMGINGYGATGGGILLNDDAGATMTSFGTSIENCHLKNCVPSTATNAATGGAIMWSTNGGAWQTRIVGNRFYKNVGDVVLIGTSNSVPQDVIIEDNVFSGPAANTDCNLYLKGGSGMNGVIIRNNEFQAFPDLGGTNDTFMDLTGCIGLLSGNRFASNAKTFGATANVKVPTTVLMVDNWQEKTATGSEAIFRTA